MKKEYSSSKNSGILKWVKKKGENNLKAIYLLIAARGMKSFWGCHTLNFTVLVLQWGLLETFSVLIISLQRK